MKVLLVSANSETSPYPVYPLGIDHVAEAISEDHDVFVLDINEAGGNAALQERIKAILPDVVGLSIRNIDNTEEKASRSYIDGYKLLIRDIRDATSAPVVLGGSGYTLFPVELIETLQADYGIIGEGERFKIFLDAYERKADVSTLDGVLMPGVSCSTAIPPPWEGRLGRLFEPESPHVDYYIQKGGGMLNLQTKRGCPFSCIYCTYPHIEGSQLRFVDPQVAADTAFKLQEAGAKYLFITDSVFNSDYDHSLEVARRFREVGVVIPWGAYIAPTKPPGDYFNTLAGAGMTHVEFGTEACSDAILENYRKPFRTHDIFFAHRAALEAGLNTAHFFLLGAPGETLQTLQETLENAGVLKKAVCFFFPGIRIYPNTRLYEIALASGQIAKDQDLLSPCFYHPEGIRLQEINETVQSSAQNRPNWVFGAGGEKTTQIISRLHARGHTGPLWEYLIR